MLICTRACTCTLHTAHCTLHIAHCTLHTAHFCGWQVFHVRRILKVPLTNYQLMSEMLAAADVSVVQSLAKQCEHYTTHGYTPDPDKAKKEKAALELKKYRESTRRRFEERLLRKVSQG